MEKPTKCPPHFIIATAPRVGVHVELSSDDDICISVWSSLLCAGYLSGLESLGAGLELHTMFMAGLQDIRQNHAISLTTYLDKELHYFPLLV